MATVKEATCTTWLGGRPRRILAIRHLPDIPNSYTEYHEWSFMDNQIMLALPAPTENRLGRVSTSIIHLADVQDGLSGEDSIIEFKLIATLPFYALRTTILSDRAGFLTFEFCATLPDYGKSILANRDVIKEKTILAAPVGRSIAVRGSSVAICVGIVTWNVDSGDITRTEIPQDERATLCFIGPTHVALAGHIDSGFEGRCAALKLFSTTSPGELVRYFCQDENMEVDSDHDTLAIPGSSVDSDCVIHHHEFHDRFTVLNKGTLMGEIPVEQSDPIPTPGYCVDPEEGAPCDELPSLVENRLLVRRRFGIWGYDEQQYHVFASRLGSFEVLYLYDFDQSRCNTLRQLTLPELQQLEARLRQQNADARVTVVSRKISFPDWEAYGEKRWRVQRACEMWQAKFPLLEFDDAPEGQNQDHQLLFTRSMICLPLIREDEDRRKLALTSSAIVCLPTGDADRYAFYFGKE
ncbi:hypothetical protein GGI43DRAFT_425012 [Trichoderma evansii]